jgi:hypothetical protein
MFRGERNSTIGHLHQSTKTASWLARTGCAKGRAIFELLFICAACKWIVGCRCAGCELKVSHKLPLETTGSLCERALCKDEFDAQDKIEKLNQDRFFLGCFPAVDASAKAATCHLPVWQQQVAAFRKKHDVSADAIWSCRVDVHMRGVSRTPRHTQILDTAWNYFCKQAGTSPKSKEAARNMFVDLSTNMSLHALGPPAKVSMCTNILAYSFELDRVLEAPELPATLGYVYEQPDVSKVSGTNTTKMCGEAMALPVLASVLMPIVLSSLFADRFAAG